MLEEEARVRWEALGSPVVPSLVVDDRVMPLLHVSQIGSALGLEDAGGHEGVRLAWDLVPIMDAWLAHLEDLPWGLVVTPTPSRGRTLRNLTVNVFHPIHLLPEAWETGRFEWDPDADPEREGPLGAPEHVREYAERRRDRFIAFLYGPGDAIGDRDPTITSPRGDVPYSVLLASQRWHAAFHYRQMVEFLSGEGIVLRGAFDVASLADLELPDSVF